ncbi:MAG: hypothetical protein LBU65_12820 [Planctomycetaceae bacterium]|jgi:hypothetical protein|nr:hypothetical protein [Planctomycetaceae bacterium]
MIYEQISTSSPKCLDGNAGFGITAQTSGIPQNISQMLHSLSGYTHRFPAGSPQNPVVFLHSIRSGYHILSRIADCGNDYSGRTNRIAHHLVITDADVRKVQFGPTDILQRYPFQTSWNQAPQLLTPIVKLPNVSNGAAKICRAWESQTGISNAGWAGVLAERAEAGQTVNVVFNSGINVLPLLGEAFLLLPAAVRWRISFSTYFMKTQETPDSLLRVHCILAGSEEEAYTKLPNVWTIDLRHQIQGTPQGKYVELAKTGQTTNTAPKPITVPMTSSPVAEAHTYELEVETTTVPLKERKVLKRGEWSESMDSNSKSQTNWTMVILCLILLILIVLIFGFVLRFGTEQANEKEMEKQYENMLHQFENTQHQIEGMKQSFEDKIAAVQKQAKEDAEKKDNEIADMKKMIEDKITVVQKQVKEDAEKKNNEIADMKKKIEDMPRQVKKDMETMTADIPKLVEKISILEEIPKSFSQLVETSMRSKFWTLDYKSASVATDLLIQEKTTLSKEIEVLKKQKEDLEKAVPPPPQQ